MKRGGWPWVRTLRQKCSPCSSPRCRWRWPAGGPACTRWTCWWACAAGGGLRLAVYLKSKNAKKYRHGMEYGSARWGTHEDITPYIDPVFQNNVILTKTESLTMNSRPKDPKTARNKNVLVIGGSGSGKTRFWLKPNLMQMHSSYVVTDPKGTILVECGKMLQRGAPKLGKDGKPMKDKHGKVIYEPYRIKVLNTINFKKSMHYNPFAYIHSEKDILKLVTTLIANTKGDGEQGRRRVLGKCDSFADGKSLRTSNGFPLFGELVV